MQWTRLDDRDEAEKGFESGEYYGAIVIPKNYWQRLASLSGPPAGAPPSGKAPAPEPAGIELLTNPAVRRSTMALTENSFAGIVGGVSGVRSEQILGGFSGRGVPPCHRRPGR